MEDRNPIACGDTVLVGSIRVEMFEASKPEAELSFSMGGEAKVRPLVETSVEELVHCLGGDPYLHSRSLLAHR